MIDSGSEARGRMRDAENVTGRERNKMTKGEKEKRKVFRFCRYWFMYSVVESANAGP
jgi:hypothetical protein